MNTEKRTVEQLTNQIDLALSNVQEAIRLTDSYKVLSELRSAEHHLTRKE